MFQMRKKGDKKQSWDNGLKCGRGAEEGKPKPLRHDKAMAHEGDTQNVFPQT